MKKAKQKSKTPFRIYRFEGGGWVAEDVSRPVFAWAPHVVETVHPTAKNWRGKPVKVRMMHGRTPFEALDRLKKAIGETA